MNKTAVVTGSSRGIGREIAKKLAENKYNVVINYNSSEEQAFSLLEEIKKFGGSAICVKTDVSDENQAEELISTTIKIFGKIDVLVNNAGVALQKLFTDVKKEEWQTLFDINIGGMFNCTKFAVRDMLGRHNGKIVNISSMWGNVGASCEVHYSASKAAVIGFTKALAREIAPSNINVNCISPGLIDTDMNFNLSCSEKQDVLKEISLGRIGKPIDIANAVLFLCSENSNFITGQNITVDGGQT